MAKWGEMELKELRKAAKDLREMQQAIPAFVEACVREVAGRLLAKVVLRTPVDSGELRRGWIIGRVFRTPTGFEVEVTNYVEYAPYVEFGHRTRDHKGWVEGRFMLTISEKELEQELPPIMKRKLDQFPKRFM